MDAMNDYLVGLKGREKEFSGEKLVEIIDGFAPALVQHLAEELDTLVALRKYGDKLAHLEKMLDEDGEKVMVRPTLSAYLFRPPPSQPQNHNCLTTQHSASQPLTFYV